MNARAVPKRNTSTSPYRFSQSATPVVKTESRLAKWTRNAHYCIWPFVVLDAWFSAAHMSDSALAIKLGLTLANISTCLILVLWQIIVRLDHQVPSARRALLRVTE